MDTVIPSIKLEGKQMLKVATKSAGSKLGNVITDKTIDSLNKSVQPDTALAIAQNARKKVFEDLNIIPKKPKASMPSVKLAAKIADPGLMHQLMLMPKVIRMMVRNGTTISKAKKEKIVSQKKFF